MFSGHPFGGRAFSDEKRGSSTINIFFGFGVRIDLEYRIYVATEEFITDATDTPPSQPYSGVLDEPMDFTWSMPSAAGFGGFITGRGSTVINNMDARFDVLTQRYTTDGQPVEVRLGKVGTPQTSWPIVFRGLSSGEFIDDASFEISTEDNGYKFDVPVQANVYAGTGGLDGNSDLAGKPRPLCFGWCEGNLTPAMVIPGELLFQVHDGRVQAISAVYDKGAALALDQDYPTVAALRAATVPPSKYATCLADGYFRVAFLDLQAGAITADVQGDVTGGQFAETTVAIVRAVIERSTALRVPADIYLPSLTVLDLQQPAPVGIFVSHNDTVSVADVIGKLMVGIGGFAGFRREGKFYVGRVDAPMGPPTKRFDKYNFDPNPQKQRLPDGIWPPPAKWLVGYGRNYTVQTDVAGVVTDDRRSWLAAEYRYATAAAPAIKVDHPFGKDPDPVPAYFRDKSDADAEAARRLALYRASRGLYSFGASDRDVALMNVGEQNWIRHTRGDLILGRYMIITSIQHKAGDNAATIQAFG
ncbi:hypothetical protein SAMN05216374_0967 [Tardiphaga sp. OK246]|uniref:hypothetical protein n=1 Tax=Tardiphaga sp. OK246 TaxID=1855307 RepID=UPI000B722F93|nr:hypothetical protein [Tardiphaga sp. OK246]SNS35943.1 hypothetical protein SAMN05216374_0967 [Tardiphaga sp. OK246]